MIEKRLEELFEGSLGLVPQEDGDLSQLPSSRGILLFADRNNAPIQLITAANIRRAAAAKLSPPLADQPTKTDLRSVTSHLFFTSILPEFQCTWYYLRLVHLLFEDRSAELINLPNPWCVRVDPEEEWTAFTPSVNPFRRLSAVYFGPFVSRRDADFFCKVYNNVFELCRSRPLALSGQGKKCTYFQMNLCPGPCMQPGSKEPYRLLVQQAIAAADGPIAEVEGFLQKQMKDFAGKMNFEQAQIRKDRLKDLVQFKRYSFKWTCRMDKLRILHIDRGTKAASAASLRKKEPVWCPFIITARDIRKLTNFTNSSGVQNFNEMRTSRLLPTAGPGETVSLLSSFLYRSSPPGTWLDVLHEEPEPEKIFKQLENRFNASRDHSD